MDSPLFLHPFPHGKLNKRKRNLAGYGCHVSCVCVSVGALFRVCEGCPGRSVGACVRGVRMEWQVCGRAGEVGGERSGAMATHQYCKKCCGGGCGVDGARSAVYLTVNALQHHNLHTITLLTLPLDHLVFGYCCYGITNTPPLQVPWAWRSGDWVCTWSSVLLHCL